jgi:pyruvate/2-oxoglutarate/acetoin dehydrogenase E1 component
MATGLALEGFVPITCYPRFDFFILAMNQLVNHLDKMREMSEDKMQPKVIIRVAVGSKKPFSAGPQHTQDHTEA